MASEREKTKSIGRLDADLQAHLLTVFNLSPEMLRRLLEELNGYYAETVEDYIQIRHMRLREEGKKNEQIYRIIREELAGRLFAAPELSLRQIRRVIYG